MNGGPLPMARLTVFVLAPVIFLIASQVASPPLTDPDAYAIYAAILPNEWPATIAKAKRLVIAEETVTLTRCKPAVASLPEEWRPALVDYDQQNKRVWRLASTFPASMIPYVIVSHSDIRKLFPGPEDGPHGVWSRFYAAYPDSGGYHELSAVGFDPSRTKAIVYVSHACGNVCGEGKYQLMEKTPEGWRAVKRPGVPPCFWVS
jgi:hypothetical protein